MTIHEEIKQILSLYINCNLDEKDNAEDIEECTNKIVSVVAKRIEQSSEPIADAIIAEIIKKLDKKIEYYEKEKKDPKVTINDNAWDCLDSKIKVLREIKGMLNKK